MIYIQGDLYVRKTFFPPTQETIERLEGEFELLLEKYHNGEMSIIELYSVIKTDYNNLNLYCGLDYTDSGAIYQLIIKEGKFYLVNYSYPENKEFFPINVEDLEKNFFSLREFIHNARYIGTTGYVENPNFFDGHLLDSFNPCTVLYEGNEGILTIINGSYTFLDRRYTNCEWVYGSEEIPEDKKTYQKFVLQLKNNWADYKKFEAEENS